MRLSALGQIWFLESLACYVQASGAVVQAGGVEYHGLQNSTARINSFYGIRYASAPTSYLRWRPPVPIKTRSERVIIDARRRGPVCPQSYPPWTPAALSSAREDEDCLLLDIVAPTVATSDKLPVMVQIHGGGYVGGSAASAPGASLVHQANGTLIYVAIQYRLGPLGFLAGDQIAANGSWNGGLLDQRAALDWVQQNIHFFGGDPEKVTIVGGSAGGASASLQMMIYHSGDFAYGTYYWGPAVDGHILHERPLEAFSRGHFHKVPILINRDGNEGFTFSNTSIATEDEVISDLKCSWPNETFLAESLTLYPGLLYNTSMIEDLTAIQALEAASGVDLPLSNAFVQRESLFGDALVNCPTRYIAEAASKAELATYKMVFDSGIQFHGSTQQFLYSDTVNPTGDTSFGSVTIPGNGTLAIIMRDYFISFAVTLDPNSALSSSRARPVWPGYQSTNDTTAILRVQNNGITISKDPDINAHCQWLAFSAPYLERI
ncbi:hypothetical protein J7T55_005269 [Diaporthe amygdali]|nr:uncharacterized protein J7T55_005269 [Diaporthe amygdali]KAJ0108292.1 hypothetical protein J7T55_005269 [Diaporthe amygdali]